MRSMTGYGEGVAESRRYRVAAAIRCVNHRFLDLVLRLPPEHRGLEAEVGRLVRRELQRGRAEVRIDIDLLGEPQVRVELHRGVLRSLREALQEAGEEGLVRGDLDAADLLRLPQAMRIEEVARVWEPEDGEALETAVGTALSQVVEARELEGGNLREAMEPKLDRLSELRSLLEGRRREIKDDLVADLRQRLLELLGDGSIPEDRLALEASLLVERGEVREELDRLRSHVEHFREVLGEPGAVGRRLEFLTQEIHRELNTLGGKCRDLEMTRWVLDCKLLGEQLREQALNVE